MISMPRMAEARMRELQTLFPSPIQATRRPSSFAKALAHGLQVGQDLQRMLPVGEGIDHGHAGMLGELHHGVMRIRRGQ